MNEVGERVSGRLRSRTAEHSEKGKHSLGFGEVDAQLGAIPGVPAERRATEPVGFGVEEQQDELEGLRQPDVIQLSGGRERDRGVASVERAAEAPVCGTL